MVERRSLPRSVSVGLNRSLRAALLVGLGLVIPTLLRAPINAVSWALVLHLPPWLSGPLLLLSPLLWFPALMGLCAFGVHLAFSRAPRPRRLFSRR